MRGGGASVQRRAARRLLHLCVQSIPQLDGAFEYLKKVGGTPLDKAQLNEAAGVGVVVSGATWLF